MVFPTINLDLINFLIVTPIGLAIIYALAGYLMPKDERLKKIKQDYPFVVPIMLSVISGAFVFDLST